MQLFAQITRWQPRQPGKPRSSQPQAIRPVARHARGSARLRATFTEYLFALQRLRAAEHE